MMIGLETQRRMDDLSSQLVDLRGIFEVADLDTKLSELDHQMQQPGFWDNPETSAPLLKERRDLERQKETLDRLGSYSEELEVWRELVEEGEGEDELEKLMATLEKELPKLELRLKLSGPDDEKDAILTLNAGAGGTESQDWAEMLLRMYLRYAEQEGYTAELLDRQEGEEAGIKSATVAIRGSYAFGYLKESRGVHRLVRISPYDAAKRRHTSFASVDVYPEVDDDIEVDIQDKDLRIDTYRSSGAGGQHVNKTESAVRITHLPTNIVVSCQNERSQIKNRATAMKMLKSRLYQREVDKRAEEHAAREGQKMEIAWGSQIRSYVLHPYRMVKDHRTGVEVGDADRVLDGDLTPFVEGFLRQQMEEGEPAAV
ncbi:MAG: peptide chain release factor 2 [Acidobacteriota bacterium]|nr:peptide chain release factor 2 [Acidobacteriota bacterium]